MLLNSRRNRGGLPVGLRKLLHMSFDSCSEDIAKGNRQYFALFKKKESCSVKVMSEIKCTSFD